MHDTPNRNGFGDEPKRVHTRGMTTPTNLGERVAATVRAHMGWQRRTVADLARVLGLGQRTAKRRYDGASAYSLHEIERIAAWLDIDKHDLAAGRLPEHAA